MSKSSARSAQQPASQRLRLWLLYLLPPVLFFSYHPLISLGSSPSMNFELSLPIIWLVVYDLVSIFSFLPLIKSHGLKRSLHGLSDAKFFLFSLFPLYLTLSCLWSSNITRALLTAGLSWALFIGIFATYELLILEYRRHFRSFWQKFKRSLYLSTAIICLFCWLQCILDLAGLPRSCTLLCPGCTYRLFGFPHPNGFTIEPQFMGNLLLAPSLILFTEIISGLHKNTRPPFKTFLLEFFFLATLFLTFSRGAIYSLCIATLFISAVYLIRFKSAQALLPLLLLLGSFLFALTAQGLMAELSPTADTFSSGITKSLHQLSLGTLDFRPAPQPPQETPPDSHPVEKPVENSSFDGYVAESTDIRLQLTEHALNLWHQSPSTLFFGVGIGAAGASLHAAYPTTYGSPKEIIQNEYASLALETGLIGLLLLATTIILVLRRLYHGRHHAPGAIILFVALALAYAISLCFFSGLANALHIYLLLAILLMNVII